MSARPEETVRVSGAADPAAPRVLVVMGVSGSGKSTVASLVAERLGWDFGEGDDMHPPANVAKMEAGTPLDDDDRAPWLRTIATWIDAHLERGEPCVVTCSALRRRYRDVLRRPGVVFVHLDGAASTIGTRIAARQGHFMPASLLDSQLTTLETPAADEAHVTIAADRTPEEETEDVLAQLGLPSD